ncbi:hypothetical protein [Brevibacterium aurantiacum]|uniref:hypothetical protein n=1 Tax=Brevibacterium aurantiacum TaxID=273384 RepID=UPI001C908B7F|nr:hypothetical protein [Brevibacterium aurantiacum]
MLSWLAKADDLSVVTIATPERSTSNTYVTFVEWRSAWAEREKTTVMIFYDG